LQQAGAQVLFFFFCLLAESLGLLAKIVRLRGGGASFISFGG